MKTIKAWIEAMRLRTLPVSVAGVLFAIGITVTGGTFAWPQAILCMVFAVLAQISSNFANEYYDFRDGLDRPGREGPRRGVTEGDISPRAMLYASLLTLAVACLLGLYLVDRYGYWWMYAVGVATALGVVAYSAGPWPLSRMGLGEVAVVIFFGVVPVNLTCLLMQPSITAGVVWSSVGVGLMGANVLIVNNYRDADDDAAVGKKTLAVRLGKKAMPGLYLVNGLLALVLTFSRWLYLPTGSWIFPVLYLAGHIALYMSLKSKTGRDLNPLLGKTAMLMLFYSLGLLISALWK
ncbi:MAG: 1,4-dihydroxy-2-naphthoate octaprenyltransferase [Lachnoclostridium sp.]|nr:1,4-dihydroxy-2-naphthoate octaprenyltransferase [Lachnoclostridium sp.]